MRLKSLGALLAGVLIWGSASVGAAQANTISILYPDNVSQVGTIGDGTFLGFIGNPPTATESATTAWSYPLDSAGDAEEAAFLNSLAGTSFTAADVDKTNTGGVSSLTFDIDTEYFSLKIDGPNVGTSFYHNTSGGVLTLTYTATNNFASGLSHITEYGDPVPGPIVGAGLPGLILACGGLLALARRRRQAVA